MEDKSLLDTEKFSLFSFTVSSGRISTSNVMFFGCIDSAHVPDISILFRFLMSVLFYTVYVSFSFCMDWPLIVCLKRSPVEKTALMFQERLDCFILCF